MTTLRGSFDGISGDSFVDEPLTDSVGGDDGDDTKLRLISSDMA
jgi:hypothetical protein